MGVVHGCAVVGGVRGFGICFCVLGSGGEGSEGFWSMFGFSERFQFGFFDY